jgi:hypothetical protein
MAATLHQYTTSHLVAALYQNPAAQTFPFENGVTRQAIVNELASRSGQNCVMQVTSNLPAVGTASGSKTVSKSVIELA